MCTFFFRMTTIGVLAVSVLAESIVAPRATAQDARQADQEPVEARKPMHVKSLEILAGRELTLLPAAGILFEAHVPVRIDPAEAKEDLRLHTVAILRNGLLLDPGLIECQVDTKSEVPRLVLKADLGKLSFAGVYTVKIQAGPADPSLAAAPMLEFTLTRPAAELQLNSPLRLERVAFLPGCSWWRPSQAALIERSGKSALTPLTSEWICELRGDGGRPAGRIKLVLPKTIGPGAQGEIAVDEKEAPSLGKSTGSLVIRAPELATEVFEATVEVTSRVCVFWLLVVIGAGIGLGYWVRVGLEGRYRRQQSNVFAAERLHNIEATINKANDKTLTHDLELIRNELQAECDKPTATPETIEAAARSAETKLAERLQKFADQETELQTKIATLRADLGLPLRQPPGVVNILRDAEIELAEVEAKLNDADLAAARSLDGLRADILGKLQEFLANWMPQLEIALDRFGAWAQTPLPAVVQRVKTQITELKAKNDLKTILQSTLQLQSDLTVGLIRTAVPVVLLQAREIHARLAKETDTNLANALTALQQALDVAEDAQAAASSETLRPLSDKIHLLREAVAAALMAANPQPAAGQPPVTPNGLADGSFDKALQDVLTRRAPVVDRVLGDKERGATLTDLELRPRPSVPDAPETIPSTWHIALEASSVAIAGRTVTLRTRVISSTAAVPILSRLRWYVNDSLVKDDRQALEYTLVAPQPSLVTVRVEAESETGEQRNARLTLSVSPLDERTGLSYLVNEMKQTERKLTIVSGIAIAAIGFLLYRNQFVGEPGDFATAFFWGFSTDIGLAKVRELSSPLVSRFSQPATAPARG